VPPKGGGGGCTHRAGAIAGSGGGLARPGDLAHAPTPIGRRPQVHMRKRLRSTQQLRTPWREMIPKCGQSSEKFPPSSQSRIRGREPRARLTMVIKRAPPDALLVDWFRHDILTIVGNRHLTPSRALPVAGTRRVPSASSQPLTVGSPNNGNVRDAVRLGPARATPRIFPLY
jgi:hypothetical protein